MIPAKYGQLVQIFFMTFLMGLLLSFLFQFQETGIAEASAFVSAWLGRFARTYVIVVPIVLVVAPLARRLTSLVLRGSE
jgi:hypothetical protein